MPAVAKHVGKAEFRSAIQQQLRNEGVFDEITASIRSRIIKSLHDENRPTAPTQATMNDQDMALLSLVYHQLDDKGYHGTISVLCAESKLETSVAFPLSSIGALKALGFEDIWKDFIQIDDTPSIKAIPFLHWIATVKLPSTEQTTAQVSQSVQTDKELVLHTQNVDPEYNKEHFIVNDCSSDEQKGHDAAKSKDPTNMASSNYNFAQRLIEIENECQQRMRRELNEKLRLSAKKQAIQATRRLEQKHKEVLKQLRAQIKAEQTQSEQRQVELIDLAQRQQILAQNERHKLEQRLDTALLEKETLLSEMGLLNERVKEIQQRRFSEWTDEHETLSRAHHESMNELEEQKRILQMQSNEVSMQKDALSSKEMRYASLERERNNLLSDIEDLRQQHTHALALQQSSFQQTQSELQTQLETLQVEFDASRNEVTGIRSLLKQSHACLESVSFREMGSARNSTNIMPTVARRLGPRVGSGDSNATGTSMSPWRHSSLTAPPATAIHGNKQQAAPVNNALGLNPSMHQQECPALGKQDVDTHPVIPALGKDPPCSSAEDPPEMADGDAVVPKNNHLQPRARKNEPNDDGPGSLDAVVGKDIILNLSAITEEAFATAPAYSPNISSLRKTTVVDGKDEGKAMGRDSGQTKVGDVHSINSQMRDKSSFDTGSDSNRRGKSPEKVTETDCNQLEESTLPKVTSEENVTLPTATVQVSGPLPPENVQISTASVASEAMTSANYSECFYTVDDTTNQLSVSQSNVQVPYRAASSDRPDRNRHAFPENMSTNLEEEEAHSDSSSSNGYSESFCSEPL